jgi:hypothetical protein
LLRPIGSGTTQASPNTSLTHPLPIRARITVVVSSPTSTHHIGRDCSDGTQAPRNPRSRAHFSSSLCTLFLVVDIHLLAHSLLFLFAHPIPSGGQELVSNPNPPCGTCPFAQRAACNSLPLRALASLGDNFALFTDHVAMYQTFLAKKQNKKSSSQPSVTFGHAVANIDSRLPPAVMA